MAGGERRNTAFPRRGVRAWGVGVLCVTLGAGALSACGGPPPEPTHAQVKPSDMPPGGDWTGVFYSPIYGHLHLIKEGNSVSGKWRTAAGDKWGELHGEATGDLLKFDWKEHKIGLVGPGSTTTGRGYFKYVVPPGENVNHEIRGEWGLGRSEVGHVWEAVRQRNMVPEPSSVAPDETEKVNVPDEWDAPARPAPGAPAGGDDDGEPDLD